MALVTARPMPPPSAVGAALGPAFDAWFLRCCARPIDQRFASVGEAVAALGQALGVKAGASPAEAYAATAFAPTASAPLMAPASPPARTDGTRNAVLIVAGVLLAGFAALVVVVVLFALPSRSGGSGSPSPTAAPAAKSACTTACAKLAECTGITDPQCEANCKRSPAFASCGAREGCEAVSSCALGVACPGKAPQGTMSCRATADCEGQCLARGGDPSVCMCSCVHLLAPDRANELAANNVCGTVRCGEACRPPVNTATCLRCFEASCMPESLACRAR